MEYEKITAQYKRDMQKNEQETDTLRKQERNLDERRQMLFEWKRRNLSFFNDVRGELRDEAAKQDLMMIDNMIGSTQHTCRETERRNEQEHEDIARRRKQLSAQRDDYQRNYRRAVQKIEEGANK